MESPGQVQLSRSWAWMLFQGVGGCPWEVECVHACKPSPLKEALQQLGGCVKVHAREWSAACRCHFECAAVDKYRWLWKMMCGCEKHIVRFGVATLARLSVSRRLFSSLSAIMWGRELPGTLEGNCV